MVQNYLSTLQLCNKKKKADLENYIYIYLQLKAIIEFIVCIIKHFGEEITRLWLAFSSNEQCRKSVAWLVISNHPLQIE